MPHTTEIEQKPHNLEPNLEQTSSYRTNQNLEKSLHSSFHCELANTGFSHVVAGGVIAGFGWPLTKEGPTKKYGKKEYLDQDGGESWDARCLLQGQKLQKPDDEEEVDDDGAH